MNIDESMSIVAQPMVIGVFEKREKAEEALEDLRRAGFTDQQIGFLYRHLDTQESEKKISTESALGAAAGAIGGGALSSFLTAAAISAIPGVGPAIAGGIIFAALGGAALGAMAGGFVGMLIGMGVPEDEAQYYQGELEHGRTIVTVKSDERYDEARQVLKQHGAYDATERMAQLQPDDTQAQSSLPAASFHDEDTVERGTPEYNQNLPLEEADTVKVENYRPPVR